MKICDVAGCTLPAIYVPVLCIPQLGVMKKNAMEVKVELAPGICAQHKANSHVHDFLQMDTKSQKELEAAIRLKDAAYNPAWDRVHLEWKAWNDSVGPKAKDK